jgi:hypothetical protein
LRSWIDKNNQNAYNKFLTPLGDVLEWCKASCGAGLTTKKFQNAYNKFLTPLGDVLEWCKASCGAGLTTKKFQNAYKKILSLLLKAAPSGVRS